MRLKGKDKSGAICAVF